MGWFSFVSEPPPGNERKRNQTQEFVKSGRKKPTHFVLNGLVLIRLLEVEAGVTGGQVAGGGGRGY